ncbi:hypothetical protein PABG_03306 [Paracoccidioides brasiliensis Pb03]|nr:hypothetical protein PABG_03306 [Paracoccidioides brasiliensis Pb03]ODH44671.1 hypothetical protein ACO22_00828 [Paracoccidioides brasiliensis]
MAVCRPNILTHLSHPTRRVASLSLRASPRHLCLASSRRPKVDRNSAHTGSMVTATVTLYPRYLGRNNSTTPQTKRPKADDYIQEIEDLYEIAKDELEIAAESAAACTIYAVSDRISLREAFDDLDCVYAAYTGSKPHPSDLEQWSVSPPQTRDPDVPTNDGSTGDKGQREEEAGTEAKKRGTKFNPDEVPEEIREEIKRRVGQRMGELRNAVQLLEESVREC